MAERKFMLPDLGVLFVIDDLDVPDACSSHDCMNSTWSLLRYICHDDQERTEVLVPMCAVHLEELESWYEKVRVAA